MRTRFFIDREMSDQEILDYVNSIKNKSVKVPEKVEVDAATASFPEKEDDEGSA